jgi:curved DNA-binding protein CbpA
MTFNPYETLGIRKDATAAYARGAYRRKAKTAHPDAGGTNEAMAELSRALAIIEDPKRRERYDQTGSVEDEPVQSEWHDALASILPAISSVVMQWSRTGQGPDLERENIFDTLIMTALKNRGGQINEVEVTKRFAAKMRKLAKRTRRRDGADSQIARAMEGEAARCEVRIADMMRGVEAIDKTLELLRAHVFDRDKSAQPAPASTSASGGGGGLFIFS